MGIMTPPRAATGTRRSLLPVREDRNDHVDILENPLSGENPALARVLEQEIRRMLKDEAVGAVEVRFRMCRDEADRFKFICKVENPPCDGESGQVQWRWWSPLMENADEFRQAFADGLRIRRDRLSGRRSPMI